MAGGYVAKFGDSIRRLAALDLAAQGNPNLTGGGPQPMTGAFDTAPQYQMRDPAREPLNQQGAFPEAPQAQGAMPPGQGPQVQGGMSAPTPGPFGADANPQKLWDEMPSDARKKVIRQVESKGIDINKIYDEKVAAGEITPPERVLSKGERLSVLTETLLRHARNAGSGQSGGAASANAILETQGRRGGLEQMAAEKEAAMKETLRQENRSDTKDATTRTQTVEDKATERKLDREDTAAKVKSDVDTREDTQKAASDLQAQQDRAAAARERMQAKGRNVQTFTDAEGNVVLIDKDTNKVIPLETETEETVTERLPRGKKIETKKRVKKPLKGIPGGQSGSQTLDPDTIMNRVTDVAKRMAEDRKTMRAITAEANEKGVDPQVLLMQKAKAAVESGIGGSVGAAGSKDDPFDYLLEK